jgi:hypothetical protein
MRETVLHGSRDLRFEEQETPTIIKPTVAVAVCLSYVSRRLH